MCCDCSGWALCLWMLTGAMCHVLCILRLDCFYCKHTVYLCGNRRPVCIWLFDVLVWYGWQMQWFKLKAILYILYTILYIVPALFIFYLFIFYQKYLEHWAECCVTRSSLECWAVSRIFLAGSHIKSVELASDNERQTYKRLWIELENRKQQAVLPLLSFTPYWVYTIIYSDW